MSGILGKKLGMTRIFQDDGRVIPVTVVQCEPNEITQVKTVEKDGYPALVLGFSKLKKPTKTKQFAFQREFRIEAADVPNYKKGDAVTVAILEGLEIVTVTGHSKGKGFQGVIRRWGFHGGPGGHGSLHHREPGSSGCRAKPGRVQKGKKYPGHQGLDRVTEKKTLVTVDTEKNIILIKGALPGPNGGLIEICK